MTCVASVCPKLIERRILAAHPKIGAYVCSFYKDGDWVEVLVDDRLLVQGGAFRGKWKHGDGWASYSSGSTFFAGVAPEPGSPNPADGIWVSILEKAYAKLHGGYGNIQEGTTRYGVRDLTGASPVGVEGISDKELMQRFQTAKDNNIKVMMGVSKRGDAPAYDPSRPQQGILPGHAYTLLKIMDHSEEGLPVLCLCRNPWGKEGEWDGPWSDNAPEWNRRTREITGYDNRGGDSDGVFCMPFEAARQVFDDWDVSFLYPACFFRISVPGEWTSETSGGCGNTGEADMLRNPQFLLEVPEPPRPEMACFGQVVLSQEDTRYTRSSKPMNGIGFHIFKSPLGGGRVTPDNNWDLTTAYGVGMYQMKRSTTSLIQHLVPGSYVVIPTTFEKGKEGPFTLSAWMSYAVTLTPLP